MQKIWIFPAKWASLGAWWCGASLMNLGIYQLNFWGLFIYYRFYLHIVQRSIASYPFHSQHKSLIVGCFSLTPIFVWATCPSQWWFSTWSLEFDNVWTLFNMWILLLLLCLIRGAIRGRISTTLLLYFCFCSSSLCDDVGSCGAPVP